MTDRKMPVQKPGRSRQDYATPDNFLAAVVRRFGPLTFDLAANATNKVAPQYYDERADSLKQDWPSCVREQRKSHKRPVFWPNPPFARIAPWAAKCAEFNAPIGCRLLFLAPASVGANWWSSFVHQRAAVLFLNGRLSFKETSGPFPKDLALCVYGGSSTGYDVWGWRK